MIMKKILTPINRLLVICQMSNEIRDDINGNCYSVNGRPNMTSIQLVASLHADKWGELEVIDFKRRLDLILIKLGM